MLGCMFLVEAYTDVTVAQARIMVDSNSVLILDVRSQSEYDSGHIRNAKVIPVTELPGRLNELNKNDSILVYCLGGGRSKTASQLLTDNGFEHVSNMLGGISAWTTAGYSVYVRYASIQQAINDAMPNTTLLVGSGTYTENLSVNKPLELVGENRSTTAISASANESERSTVVINASNVQMREFTIRSSNGSSSLGSVTIRIARPYDNNTISDNRLSSDCSGIEIFNSTSNTIEWNDIESARQGIVLDSALDNNISNNRIASNFHGLEVRDSTSNTIFGNCIENNTVGILVDSSSNNDLHNNNITGNTYGMIFTNSTGNTARENNVANNAIGIYLTISNHNTIIENNMTLNNWGIDIQSSSNNGVNKNSVRYNNVGISLLGCSNNSLTANQVASNNNDGILIDTSSSNRLDQNIIETNGDNGVLLLNSSDNNIRVNRIANNNHTGISLDFSSNNDVYRNDFVNNTRQAFNDLFSVNIWDHGYPSGGNYWSDCNKTDSFKGPNQNETGNDGIVDTPYVIDENNTDRYSLMRPYSTRCDITGPDGNPDGKVDMRDISHVARRFLYFPGNPLWDPYADINGDAKIDMIDIGTVARFFGAHY